MNTVEIKNVVEIKDMSPKTGSTAINIWTRMNWRQSEEKLNSAFAKAIKIVTVEPANGFGYLRNQLIPLDAAVDFVQFSRTSIDEGL
jgi:hypothetical protein